MRSDLDNIVSDEMKKLYWAQLQSFVQHERATTTVYPDNADVLNALNITPLTQTRVVILGQDPYHGPGQAHGLAFSVRRGVKTPPSLANIFKELTDDIGIETPTHGCLEHWAQQGVLLLNSTLTVRLGCADSHSGHGWETFTDTIIAALGDSQRPIVFVLWGTSAREKRKLIRGQQHTVIESAHPSPLSAYRGFFGSRPFSAINRALIASGSEAIDWHIN